MIENSDAPSPDQPQAPAEYTPLGADLAAPVEEHPEFFKPKPEDEPTVLPATALDLESGVPERSNRTGAVWIALAGGLTFSLLYLAATVLYSWATRVWGEQGGNLDVVGYVQSSTLTFVSTPVYWLTSLAFFVYFTLLALLFYRATWRTYVIAGIVVALLTYLTAIAAGLLTISAWTLTYRDALAFTWRSIALNPLILVSLILAREIPIWFGGWIALRAKKLREKDLSS